jgi:hypothetical protein
MDTGHPFRHSIRNQLLFDQLTSIRADYSAQFDYLIIGPNSHWPIEWNRRLDPFDGSGSFPE